MDEEIERMNLEADLNNLLIDWIESAVDKMTLQELRDITKKLKNEELKEVKIRKPRRDK